MRISPVVPALLLFLLLSKLVACGGGDSVDPQVALQQKPTIYGVGISIPDIPLQHEVQPQLFVEFGFPVDGAGEAGWKYLAHPEFYLPIGYTVTAVSEGVVRDIVELDGPNDQLIMVTPDDAPLWTIGYEHVSNVMVTVGQRVSVGDIVAEISPDNSQFFQGFGKTAIMVFVDTNNRNANLAYCPFLLLDNSVRQTVYDQINTHVQQWEANKGEDIFNENEWSSVGCYFETTDG